MKLKEIKKAWIIITSDCNNNCLCCYSDNMCKKNELMSFEKIVKVINFIKKINCKRLVLTGGEPTLHPDFDRIVDIAVQKGFFISIPTNGRNLTNKNSILKNKNKLSLSISVHGSNSNIHDNITKSQGSFNETTDAIKFCTNHKIDVATATVINKHNILDTPQMIKYVSDIGIKKIKLYLGIPPLNSYFDPNDYLTINEFGDKVISLFELAKNNGLNLYIEQPLPLCSLPTKAKELLISGEIKYLPMCHIPFGYNLVVDYEENLIPCPHITEIKIGNIETFYNNNSFEDFWTGTLEKNFRKKMRKYPLKECRVCADNNYCIGGCPLLWSFKSN